MSNVDYERLAWISERYKNTFRHDETYQIAREILITIADWMDHEARPGSTITAETLRAIADAKPDPDPVNLPPPTIEEAIEKLKFAVSWCDEREDALAERMDRIEKRITNLANDFHETASELYADIRRLKLQ